MAYFLWSVELGDEEKCRSAKSKEKYGWLNDFLIFLYASHFSNLNLVVSHELKWSILQKFEFMESHFDDKSFYDKLKKRK